MATAAARTTAAATVQQVEEEELLPPSVAAIATVHPVYMSRCRYPPPMYLVSICPTAAATTAEVVSFIYDYK